jgi:poly-gamma-glutamate synthesis protein (capsule biosynthesis protein)
MCGDVMTGRGLDQILSQPVDPVLFEPRVHDARDYVSLAESAHGRITRPVRDDYIWGEALQEWDRVQPHLRIVNLETAITTSDRFWKGKEVHYRMSPRNIGCLKAAGIDCCVLANNHILDWGNSGLTETIETLRCAHVTIAGAGENQAAAEAPAKLELAASGRVLVFAFGSETSGIPGAWAAGDSRPGINLLPDFSGTTVSKIRELVTQYRRQNDVTIASLHWGGNWGYAIPDEHRTFAHQLIDEAGIDLVHGHSSHHVQGIEVYHDRLILYGCGDFVTDYEGISGYEHFRGDLAVMYFASVDRSSGRILRLEMTPLQARQMRLRHADAKDAAWLANVLNHEGKRLGTTVHHAENDTLVLRWGSLITVSRRD